MTDQNITRHVYTDPIRIDARQMVDGMVELFDDLCDMTLSRLYAKTEALDGGFDFNALPQDCIDRFKIAWFVSMAELMFYEMAVRENSSGVSKLFYDELEASARERRLEDLYRHWRKIVPELIAGDRDFRSSGLFNFPMSNNPDDTQRNSGLGPAIARQIMDESFGGQAALAPVFDDMSELFEAEFINAYGHCSIACAPFEFI